jgi:surfactin synthase thioesterase subunit
MSFRLVVLPSAGAGIDPFKFFTFKDAEVIGVMLPGRPG